MRLTDKPEYFRLAGAAYEVGRQQGETLAPFIRSMWRKLRIPFYGWRTRELQARLRFLIRETEKRFPQEVEEIRGIADGSGLDLYQAFLINRHLGHAVACSAMAVTRSTYGPVGGANLDEDAVYYIKDSHVKGQYRYLVTTVPGTLGGGNGMNDQGLVLLGSNAHLPPEELASPPDYLTDDFQIAARVLRSCSTVREAVEFISRPDVGGHGNHVLLDASGNAACVEKERHRLVAVRRPEADGFIFSLNYFASLCATEDDLRNLPTRNIDRLAAVRAHRQRLTARNGLRVIKDILCDTTDNGANWPVSNRNTVFSFIALPRRLELRVSDGPPHLSPYHTYSLQA